MISITFGVLSFLAPAALWWNWMFPAASSANSDPHNFIGRHLIVVTLLSLLFGVLSIVFKKNEKIGGILGLIGIIISLPLLAILTFFNPGIRW